MLGLLVHAPVQPFYQPRSTYTKGSGDFQEGSYCDGSPRLDLLPMSGRKAKTDHVFLGISMGLTQLLDSSPKSPKELSFINHRTYVENGDREDHEQNSCGLPGTEQLYVGELALRDSCGLGRGIGNP